MQPSSDGPHDPRVEPAAGRGPRRWRNPVLTILAAGVVAMVWGVVVGQRAARPAAVPTGPVAGPTSASCRECHREIFAAWADTDHAQANRPVDPERDAEALRLLAAADPAAAQPEFVLGQKPSRQLLIPAAGGRWQPHELAYDPSARELFNVFGDEQRQPGEWGHWTGRGMNWNSMCAPCHMTGYEKRYDAAADAYRSTWVEHGVGCIQCHGPVAADHGQPGAVAATVPPPPFRGERAKMMQTCAPCHARNEALTERFQPGDAYHDHYRVVLPVDPAVFHPDGRQRDEVFNWTSVLLSRMGHAGVSCLDCHDPHTNRTTLPVTDNQLCLQCHTPPGRQLPGGARAVPIDPVAHSGHPAGSTGTSCVACHMPTTNYLQRSPRHDHGWLSPDPLLTRELGIPNACANCHAERGLDWSIAATAEMFGTKVLTRQRQRARTVAAAQAGQPDAAERLLELLRTEDIPTWRATYLSLLAGLGGATEAGEVREVREVALHSLRSPDANERAAAVRLLATMPGGAEQVRPQLADPARLVRLDAAWALAAERKLEPAQRPELDAYLQLARDQPSGRVRIAFDLANRGEPGAALTEVSAAVGWDPHSAGIHEAKAAILTSLGRPAEAARSYLTAAELTAAGAGPLALRAGLSFAEAGQAAEAEQALRFAVRKDPAFHRAAYNLGLLLAQAERLAEAAEFLGLAERQDPREPAYPYALATVKLRQRDRVAALAAAERVLALDPTNEGARQIVRTLSGR